MKATPIGDQVIIRRDEAETRSRGGIWIPDVAKEKPLLGTIAAVGPGRTLEDGTPVPMQVKVGDRVVFMKHAGDEQEIGGEKVLIVHEGEILAVLD